MNTYNTVGLFDKTDFVNLIHGLLTMPRYAQPQNSEQPNIFPGKVIPFIKRAIFKLDKFNKVYDEKTKKNKLVPKKEPVLVTKVEFNDGTYTIVKNCSNDKIDLVEAEDPETHEKLGVKIASLTSKESAIAYAIFKRMYGKPNPKNENEYITAGAGNVLANIIENSWDQDYEEVMSPRNKERTKAANVARHEKIQREAHARKVRKVAKQLRLKAEAEALNVKNDKPILVEAVKKSKKR